jgi:hypothetical protein
MPDPCLLYRIKITTLRDKTISLIRNLLQPHVSRRGYCAHPESKYLRNTFGPSVPCCGELEKCIIPPEDRKSA